MGDKPAALADPTNDPGAGPPPDGTGLCMSGGGYRAMLFHLGTLWRLYEAGRLRDVTRISSVSGGSITAGALALAWPRLSFDPARVRADFVPLVVDPVRRLADHTLDAGAIIGGALLPGTIADRIAAAYREHLFGQATLQSLPDAPRFVINATNVQSGALWRFSKPFMGDYRVGLVRNPKLELATAVAASSAFPPMLSPVTLKLDPATFEEGSGEDLQRKPFTSRVVLTDGGVYDNMGLETVWKRCATVFVSDGGGKLQPEEEPHGDWARHAYRVLDLVDNQVRSLRKRHIMAGFQAPLEAPDHRGGAYWGIRTDIADYGLASTLPCPHDATLRLAAVATRLKRLDDVVQERLVNWGYAVCDAALRAHVDPAAPMGEFPYRAAGI